MRHLLIKIQEKSLGFFQAIQKKASLPAYAVMLLFVMIAAYNAQLFAIGYYYDDWEGVFLQKQQFSFQQIWEYFLIDRPFSTLAHFAFNPILGTAPAGWRILGMLINWGAVLFFVKGLMKIWPNRVLEIGWVGLLLAVYPGITRQFVIRTSLVHYISLLLFTLSLWLMIKAVLERRNQVLLTALSISLAILQMLIIEYFAGLELIRVFLLYYIFQREMRSPWLAARKAFAAWLPYVMVFAAFLVFRLGILPQIQLEGMKTKNTPWVVVQFLENPARILVQQVEIVLQDVVYAVLYIWSQTIIPEAIDLQARAALASWALAAICALAAGVLMIAWQRKTGNSEGREPYPHLIVLLCLAAILLGGLPLWAIGRQATKGMWASRYLFGIVMGAVPLVVVFVSWATGQYRRAAMNIILAALLMGSVSLQFRTANKYALAWHYARDYYWQMKWRAPSLQPGAFILSPYTPFPYNADYQIAFAINVLYAPGYNSSQARYWWFDGPDDLRNPDTLEYPIGMPIDHSFRTISFKSSMDKALPVIYNPARGCLQVVDPVYQTAPFLSAEEVQLFPAANKGLIGIEEQPTPEDVFGREPPRGWCYLYQSADLARSMQRWDQVIAAWDEATQRELKPRYGPEYLPFIEAFAHQGNWEKSAQITQAAFETTEKMEPFLCGTWERMIAETQPAPDKQPQWEAVNQQLSCTR